MKTFITTLTASLFISFFASAQTAPAGLAKASGPMTIRRVRINFVGKDSVNLALNEDFDMIEDSCSQIVRHGHLKQRKFFGPFTDVSRIDPSLILTEGNYSADGLKDGPFISHYLNGKLQAKGNFKNNQYDGHWEIFYDDDKPKLTFDANNGDITITDAWDEKGSKTIVNGKGTYRVDIANIYWRGKLLNGKPDGTWKAYKTDDATNTDIISESYKNGVFQKGKGPLGEYTDAPRMILIPTDKLPFTRAEKLRISAVPCNGVKRKHIVNAQYQNGLSAFSEEIKQVVSPYLGRVNLQPYDDKMVVEGEVTESGKIGRLDTNSPFNPDIARGLVQQLNRLPPLQPATADGKPITQKFTITFTFQRGMYSFSYRFLPIDQSTLK
ncbi:toxin-antitoxin system YwqK family antitoxin [Mucilaginibacter sp. AW1-3]